jgi:hypothetical protein
MKLEPLRHSALKRIGQSPLHYAARVDASAKWLDKGSGAHSAILGGPRLVVWDKNSDKGNQCPRRGKDYDAFEADHAGALILLPDEYEQVQQMRMSVLRCPEAMRVLKGVRETTVLWDASGRVCRGTPDVDGGSFVTELKTTKCADPRKFKWDALKFCYHGALAWYMDGLSMQRGREVMPEAAFIVAVESIAPFDVVVYRLPDTNDRLSLDAGRRMNRAWFERLRACEESDQWPGYAQSIVDLSLGEEEPQLVFSAEEAEAA